MLDIAIIPHEEFRRVAETIKEDKKNLGIIADMCRLNTLVSVKKAGSGHLGSSFSAMDIAVWLYYYEMNVVEEGIQSPDRDIYFSSKGHDVPGLYAVLHSLGILPEDQLLALRRIDGVDGHPNVRTPGIEANTGSLGMGISRGKGVALGKKLNGNGGEVYVMTGDGEFQEGQIYESLQTTAFQKVDNLTVVIDHNKVQSDCFVKDIIDLGDLEEKLRVFGWHVERCNGNDYEDLARAFLEVKSVKNQPKIIIADTIKGKGISFMEHTEDMKDGGFYRWHSGAPGDEAFIEGYKELKERVDKDVAGLGIAPLVYTELSIPEKKPSGVTSEYVADAFGKALVDVGRDNKKLVVIDADLAADCRVRTFGEEYPDRFFENGIAEQDMVSMAGGMAKEGLVPVVNSFASFLASRANEQIYNNAGEDRKVIYACHYAGLLPAGPGLSHQSVRDISLFGAFPNVEILQPGNSKEAEDIVKYAVDGTDNSVMIRLIIGPSPRNIELPSDYSFEYGKGSVIRDGKDAVIFTAGPVMLHEALKASELLEEKGFGLKVVNMPWLNRTDEEWFCNVTGDVKYVYTLDDHSVVGGLGDSILNSLNNTGLIKRVNFEKLGLTEYPEWGTPPEVLGHHKLDGLSISNRIKV